MQNKYQEKFGYPVDSNPKAGLVFFIPRQNHTVRVSGRVKVIERAVYTT